MAWGIATASGLQNFVSADLPNEVVLAKGKVKYNRNPIFRNTWNGCSTSIDPTGNYHVPVEIVLNKNFNMTMTGALSSSRPYFYKFINCTLVAGCSSGRSVGFYGGANHSNVVTPCGFPRAVWSESSTQIRVKYFGIWSGTETAWRSSAKMSGTLYVMLVGQLPANSLQELPKYGIMMKNSGGNRITFNSNYEPSNPRHFVGRPPYNLNNYRSNFGWANNMSGGTKMTTIAPVAMCYSGNQRTYTTVWPCFSSDGRRMGTRTQEWGNFSGQPPGWDPRTHMMPSDALMRVWNVADYF